MEHLFGCSRVMYDAQPARRHRRSRRSRRSRTLAAAAALATAGLVLLGGVAYGGASSGPQRVTTRAGETLWSIAASHYGGDDVQAKVAQIEAANRLSSPALRPGQVLVLPAS